MNEDGKPERVAGQLLLRPVEEGARPHPKGEGSGLKALLPSYEVERLAKAGREIIERLTAPKLREIVREEL
ncbi:MAG: hypothetical protein QXI97_07540 [Nitrososphaerota archaeon]